MWVFRVILGCYLIVLLVGIDRTYEAGAVLYFMCIVEYLFHRIKVLHQKVRDKKKDDILED